MGINDLSLLTRPVLICHDNQPITGRQRFLTEAGVVGSWRLGGGFWFKGETGRNLTLGQENS